jgi:hypothetical protein
MKWDFDVEEGAFYFDGGALVLVSDSETDTSHARCDGNDRDHIPSPIGGRLVSTLAPASPSISSTASGSCAVPRDGFLMARDWTC